MHTDRFEKLDIWIEAKARSKNIYIITNEFPADEKFGLTLQLRSAPLSIRSNIAEGLARKTNKDKAHFTIMAFSFAVEVLNQIIIAHNLDFIDLKQYSSLREQFESITNKLNALKNYQTNKRINK